MQWESGMLARGTLAAAAVLAAALFGCRPQSVEPVVRPDPFEVRQLPAGLVPDVTPLVEANTRFALDLYGQLRTSDGNLFFSPFSVSTALAMTYAGAAGRTASEMGTVLHFPPSQPRLHEAYGALLASLDRGSALGGYTLTTAQGLWTQTGFPFRDTFVATVRGPYQAELAEEDFSRAPDAARTAINGWASRRTAGRIPDLFPLGTITSDTRFVLGNAIYFKGTWAVKFDRAKTRQIPFRVTADRSVTVPMMTREDTVAFARADGLQILDLPYSGRDLSMVILLPDRKDGLADLESRLTYENVARWLAAPRVGGEVYVALPRFEVRSPLRLDQPLIDLGMPSAFTNRADFSALSQVSLVLQAVVHQGWVKVDEEGTEAAAATGVSGGLVSMPPSFMADHPFLFLILDHVTGSVLFVGRVVDPSV